MFKLAVVSSRYLRKPVTVAYPVVIQTIRSFSEHKGCNNPSHNHGGPINVTVNHSKKREEGGVNSELEQEKELYKMKRSLSESYSKGDYEKALSFAVQLREKSYEIYGPENAIVASAINNVALMVCYN